MIHQYAVVRTPAFVFLLLPLRGWAAPPAPPRPPEPRTLLVIEPSKEAPRNSEGDVLLLKDGRRCLVYSRFHGGADDSGAADLAMRTSADGGKSWTPDRILLKNEGRENVMSVTLRRLDDGRIMLFYLLKNGCNDCRGIARFSNDELATLGEPIRATTEDGYHVVNNDRIVQLSSGRLIIPADLHPCPTGEWNSFSMYATPRVYFSDDLGRTWQRDKTFGAEPPIKGIMLQEPGIVELQGGRLMMWFRTDAGRQFQCFSDDQGLHWSVPEPGPLHSPCSPATIERLPWSGELLAVWNDHSGWHTRHGELRNPLCIALSRDDGQTWSPSRVIEGQPDGCFCYTSMSFIGNDVVLSYCAGDERIGRLNRLKVLAIPHEWLAMRPGGAATQPER